MATQSPVRRFLSLREAAAYTGLSVRTLRRRISDGSLTGYRHGSRVIRVDRREVDDLLKPIRPVGGVA